MSDVLIVDSEFPPTSAQIAAAKAEGVQGWMGYVGPGAGHDWTLADFERVKAGGLAVVVIAFPVAGSDPRAAATFARSLGARLMCDNAYGDGVDPLAPSAGSWMAAARSVTPTAMYGQKAVLEHWAGHYDGAVICGVGGPSNNPLGLSVPAGNQNWNGTIAGLTCDRGVYDPWFLGHASTTTRETDMLLIRDDTSGATSLVIGDAVVIHVDTPASVSAFEGAGVGLANIDSAEYAAIVAAIQARAASPASVDVPVTLTLAGALKSS